MNFIIDFALARLKERSTWVGLISMLTAAGVTLEPNMTSLIAAAGAAIAGAVLVVTRDHTSVAVAAVDAVEEILPAVKDAVEPKADEAPKA